MVVPFEAYVARHAVGISFISNISIPNELMDDASFHNIADLTHHSRKSIWSGISEAIRAVKQVASGNRNLVRSVGTDARTS